MVTSSLGYHTFTICQRLTLKEAIELYKAFKNCKEVTVFLSKKDRLYPNADEFIKSLYGSFPIYYKIVYANQVKGISWTLRVSSQSLGFITDTEGESKPCSIKATINPKIFTGIKDYVSAANQLYLDDVISKFDFEAKKISCILGSFDMYSLNRSDYCVNFDLEQLCIYCSKEHMMALIKRANIPNFFTEWTEYDQKSHRQKTCANSFYLKNGSVNINCYCKYYQLQKEYPDCPNINDSLNVIRFEVQCKYLKTYSMSKAIKDSYEVSNSEIVKYLLSDGISENSIKKYYYKILRKGDYYTLSGAKQRIIQLHNFNENKENRLFSTLELVNKCRGISKAKSTLQGKDLENFNRSLRDLDEIRINPVTIPKEWGIKYIENLLNAYYNKLEHDQISDETRIQNLKDYFEGCKKLNKKSTHKLKNYPYSSSVFCE